MRLLTLLSDIWPAVQWRIDYRPLSYAGRCFGVESFDGKGMPQIAGEVFPQGTSSLRIAKDLGLSAVGHRAISWEAYLAGIEIAKSHDFPCFYDLWARSALDYYWECSLGISQREGRFFDRPMFAADTDTVTLCASQAQHFYEIRIRLEQDEPSEAYFVVTPVFASGEPWDAERAINWALQYFESQSISVGDIAEINLYIRHSGQGKSQNIVWPQEEAA